MKRKFERYYQKLATLNEYYYSYHTWSQSSPSTSETSFFSWWDVQVICFRQTRRKYIVIQFQWRRQFKDYPIIVTCYIIVRKIIIWNYSLNVSHLIEEKNPELKMDHQSFFKLANFKAVWIVILYFIEGRSPSRHTLVYRIKGSTHLHLQRVFSTKILLIWYTFYEFI